MQWEKEIKKKIDELNIQADVNQCGSELFCKVDGVPCIGQFYKLAGQSDVYFSYIGRNRDGFFPSSQFHRINEFLDESTPSIPSSIVRALKEANPFRNHGESQMTYGYDQAVLNLTELLSAQPVSDDAAEKEVMIQAFDKVRRLFELRSWIMEGRGSYRYDDDRYKEEVRYLYDEFDQLQKDTWANIKSKSVDFRKQVIADYLAAQPAEQGEDMEQLAKEIWKMAMIYANNLCVGLSDDFNNDDEIVEASAASRCANLMKSEMNHPHPDVIVYAKKYNKSAQGGDYKLPGFDETMQQLQTLTIQPKKEDKS